MWPQECRWLGETTIATAGRTFTWGICSRRPGAGSLTSGSFRVMPSRQLVRNYNDSHAATRCSKTRATERFGMLVVAAGVTMGRWAWSSPFVDINNDGWEDLIVANGYVTGRDAGDL